MAESAALLVDEIFPQLPIRQWVLSVPFALRFLLAREPQVMGSVLRIVYRAIASDLITQAGFTAATAQTGAVTLIDRAHPCARPFGRPAVVPIGSPADWAALWIGAQSQRSLPHAIPRRRIPHHGGRPELPPSQGSATPAALDLLVHTLSDRIARHLERRGLRVRDPENDYLTLGASDDSTLDDLRGHSIPYRIALGPHAGRKAFTLQTLPRSGEFEHGLARANGFSLHAGVVAARDERAKLERLCRYITRPAVSTERLSLTAQGLIHYRLKTP